MPTAIVLGGGESGLEAAAQLARQLRQDEVVYLGPDPGPGRLPRQVRLVDEPAVFIEPGIRVVELAGGRYLHYDGLLVFLPEGAGVLAASELAARAGWRRWPGLHLADDRSSGQEEALRMVAALAPHPAPVG